MNSKPRQLTKGDIQKHAHEAQKSCIRLLKLRSYLNVLRLACEQSENETNAYLGFSDVVDDAICILDEAYNPIDKATSFLNYGFQRERLDQFNPLSGPDEA